MRSEEKRGRTVDSRGETGHKREWDGIVNAPFYPESLKSKECWLDKINDKQVEI